MSGGQVGIFPAARKFSTPGWERPGKGRACSPKEIMMLNKKILPIPNL